MDFIEQLFGVSPDGGYGATEDLVVAIVIAIICGFVARHALRRSVAYREAEAMSKRNH